MSPTCPTLADTPAFHLLLCLCDIFPFTYCGLSSSCFRFPICQPVICLKRHSSSSRVVCVRYLMKIRDFEFFIIFTLACCLCRCYSGLVSFQKWGAPATMPPLPFQLRLKHDYPNTTGSKHREDEWGYYLVEDNTYV